MLLACQEAGWLNELGSSGLPYYNLCGIRSQHSTISKGEKGDSLEHIYLHYTLPTFAL
jgi:hypothetical protein